jgi:hypothetical protein
LRILPNTINRATLGQGLDDATARNDPTNIAALRQRLHNVTVEDAKSTAPGSPNCQMEIEIQE